MKKFWVVTRPGLDSTLADFVFETDVEGLGLMAISAAGGRPATGPRPFKEAEAFATAAEAYAAATNLLLGSSDGYDDLAHEAALEAARFTGPAGPRPEGLAGEAWDQLREGL